MSAEVVDWRRDREVARLTREIVALEARSSVVVADTLVEIGARIQRARERLPHGQWLEWIGERLPFQARAAQRYIALAEFAESEPAQYRRLRKLGPSKLHLIVPLPPGKRRELQPSSMLAVRGKKKAVETMTVVELADALGLKAPTPAEVPINKLVQAARHRTAALDAIASELLDRKAEIDPALLRGLRDEIAGVLAQLDAGLHR